jgi:ribonucleoside-diphosphate reductase beta chain
MENRPGEKRLLNCSGTDPNKILPMKYNWARKHYKDGVANNWTPEEVNMQKDVEMWRSPDALTSHERRLVLWNMGFFSTAESLTANNIVLNVYRHVTNPECRRIFCRALSDPPTRSSLLRHARPRPGRGVQHARTDPSIRDKDEFVIDITKSILDPHFSTEGREKLVRPCGLLRDRGIFFCGS